VFAVKRRPHTSSTFEPASARSRAAAVVIFFALIATPPHAAFAADSLYKYRDSNGNLVYSDSKPDAPSAKVESLSVNIESKAPRIDITTGGDTANWKIIATNECLCEVEFEARSAGRAYHRVLAPRSQETLAEGPRAPNDNDSSARLSWRAILGSPGAQHTPRMPYRAPFAVGTSYLITQAFPMRVTHTSAADQFAIDIALPDGTPVDAAREGVVINVRHDRYLGAASPVMLDQANMVEILHDDGTIALYAHLHWDSVRVQPGQSVRRGEYIANSGSTGFSSGAHLHFAVVRNAGMAEQSVPVEFQGPGGTAVTPVALARLTAY
jgi:murein DD-endopeptidase MepM/ murein hydrolase activator NlpD